MVKNRKNRTKWWLESICGSIIGFINGLLGSGGGMIAVPILEKVKNLDEKKSHATALAVMLPFSLVSAFIYALNFEIDWVIALILMGGVTVGGILGSVFLKNLSGKVIRIIFSVLMAFSGVWILCN